MTNQATTPAIIAQRAYDRHYFIEEIGKAFKESEARVRQIRDRYAQCPDGAIPSDQIEDLEALERERDLQDDLEIKWHRLRLGEPSD